MFEFLIGLAVGVVIGAGVFAFIAGNWCGHED